MILRNFAVTLIATSSLAFGQTQVSTGPNSPNIIAAGSVVVKSSPASDALVSAAKEMNQEQSSFDNALKQARSTLEASQKELSAQLSAAQKDLTDKMKADKKYAPILSTIDTLQKQLADLQNQAQQKFGQASAPIQNKIATDKALIDGLVPVVRKENDLPDTATFDPATQKWSEANPVETKK